jgi:hypothetical protein
LNYLNSTISENSLNEWLVCRNETPIRTGGQAKEPQAGPDFPLAINEFWLANIRLPIIEFLLPEIAWTTAM